MRRTTVLPAVFLSLVLPLTARAQTTVAIHDIQGSGATSPLSGQTVITTGIVTAVRSTGFYLQSPDAEADTDPATSQGIFVFTSSAPSVARGNRVSVTGRVAEYIPSADPSTRPLTEIAGNPVIAVLAQTAPLPAPVHLTASHTNPAGGPDVLERFEGMRVHIDELMAIGPTGGSIDEAAATSTSNGTFWAVIAGVARPVREPGVDVLDTLPASSPCCVPRFDGNPERLRVESAAQPGAFPLEVTTGASIRNVYGVVDWGFRTWTIVVDVSPTPHVTRNYGAAPLAPAAADEMSVATMNLQRLFDTRDTKNVADVVVSPAGYAKRIEKIARAITAYLAGPDVIAVQETEDLNILQDIAAAVRTLTEDRVSYTAVMYSGNDPSGINVGFLVNANTSSIVATSQELRSATFISPRNGRTETLHDRPPVLAEVLWTSAAGKTLHFQLLAIHARSMSGIETADDGTYVRYKRKAQAESIVGLAEALQELRPSVPLMILGDFNAFDVNDGWFDLTGTLVGSPAPADRVVVATDARLEPQLALLSRMLPPSLRYTYVHRGTAQTLDQIATSRNLLPHVRSYHVVHLNADFPESLRNEGTRVERFSDHDVPVVRLTTTLPTRRRGVTPPPIIP